MSGRSVHHSPGLIDHSDLPSDDAAGRRPFCVSVIVLSAFAEVLQPVAFATLLLLKHMQSIDSARTCLVTALLTASLLYYSPAH